MRLFFYGIKRSKRTVTKPGGDDAAPLEIKRFIKSYYHRREDILIMETVIIPISSLILVLSFKKLPFIGGNIKAALGITALLSLIMGGYTARFNGLPRGYLE